MVYINMKIDGRVETVDEYETRKEAYKILKEYRLSSSYYAGVYLSSRCTNEWKNQ